LTLTDPGRIPDPKGCFGNLQCVSGEAPATYAGFTQPLGTGGFAGPISPVPAIEGEFPSGQVVALNVIRLSLFSPGDFSLAQPVAYVGDCTPGGFSSCVMTMDGHKTVIVSRP
jgi:hypothetical protein